MAKKNEKITLSFDEEKKYCSTETDNIDKCEEEIKECMCEEACDCDGKEGCDYCYNGCEPCECESCITEEYDWEAFDREYDEYMYNDTDEEFEKLFTDIPKEREERDMAIKKAALIGAALFLTGGTCLYISKKAIDKKKDSKKEEKKSKKKKVTEKGTKGNVEKKALDEKTTSKHNDEKKATKNKKEKVKK